MDLGCLCDFYACGLQIRGERIDISASFTFLSPIVRQITVFRLDVL
jgi:hypothetical protein